jgi:hypothetical protein
VTYGGVSYHNIVAYSVLTIYVIICLYCHGSNCGQTVVWPNLPKNLHQNQHKRCSSHYMSLYVIICHYIPLYAGPNTLIFEYFAQTQYLHCWLSTSWFMSCQTWQCFHCWWCNSQRVWAVILSPQVQFMTLYVNIMALYSYIYWHIMTCYNKIQLCPHDAMHSKAKLTSHVCSNHTQQIRVAGQRDTPAQANDWLTSDLDKCMALYAII